MTENDSFRTTHAAAGRVQDPFAAVSLARVFDLKKVDSVYARELFESTFDVCVIGSGPGGAVAACHAAKKGLRTLLVEEGPFLRAQDFSQDEVRAARLYQDSMKRRTADGAITVLQGRVVGGSSTVNWTSSFKIPQAILEHWKTHFGVSEQFAQSLLQAMPAMCEKLSVREWDAPNGNNEVLRVGLEKLGYKWGYIPRNVTGCWNIGFCGMGCPTNAKVSALTAFLPEYLAAGGSLLANAFAHALIWQGARVAGVRVVLPGHSHRQSEVISAKHFVVSCGGIGSPALLLRSAAPDPFGRLGRRTFLHPVVTSFAKFKEPIDPYFGAPQSVYSDHFLWPDLAGQAPGFKIEAMPLAPLFAAGLSPFHGEQAIWVSKNLSHLHGALALQRDGFHEDSPGGCVRLATDGAPLLDYPLNEYHMRGFRNALVALAEMQFAAGAQAVLPLHTQAEPFHSVQLAQTGIAGLPMRPYAIRVGSAHVMGGCAMSADPRLGVVGCDSRHHQFENLNVMDGSVFPTALGVNPQITVFSAAQCFAEETFGKLS